MSYGDEKGSPVDEKHGLDLKEQVTVQEVGDVSEDVRAIDLGADGKERPIGMHVLLRFVGFDVG
jgi:hypothetical protein